MLELPPPSVFGLPPKFDDWREAQQESIQFALDCPKRFVMQAAPTGFGKSLAYVVQAVMQGGRAAILTSTKGLQDQLTRDFESIGLKDIRGRNAYPCKAGKDFGLKDASCAEGPCHLGAPCILKDGGCDYFDAVRRANASRLVVSNYSYWMHSNRYGMGLGNFDLLVLDEAHDAPDALSSFVAVNLDIAELGGILDDARTPDVSAPIKEWSGWAAARLLECEARICNMDDSFKRHLRNGGPPVLLLNQLQRANRLCRKLESIASAQGQWVIEHDNNFKRIIRLTPVWAVEYAERYLFRSIPKVVMYSATIRPKTASLLGIRPNDFVFKEYASSFPVSRRRVYHVETIPVKFDSTDEELRTWVNRIDQIIRGRLDRKGIIHSVSFARRDLIIKNSEYKHIMLWNSTENTVAAVDKFKRLKAPLVLVSPSVMTGYDFPYDDCRYQIIAKVPFPDYNSPLSKARDRTDSEWGRYSAVQSLVQATGRGMRAADDFCETFVVDDNVCWLINRCKQFVPKWWLESFASVRTIPAPSRT